MITFQRKPRRIKAIQFNPEVHIPKGIRILVDEEGDTHYYYGDLAFPQEVKLHDWLVFERGRIEYHMSSRGFRTHWEEVEDGNSEES